MTDTEKAHVAAQFFVERYRALTAIISRLYPDGEADFSPASLGKVQEAEFVFILRCAQLMRWAKALKKEASTTLTRDVKQTLTKIERTLTDVISLRDFHMHEDEYLLGAGKNQDRYDNFSNGLSFVQTGGHGSVSFQNCKITIGDVETQIDQARLIGGRVEPTQILNMIASDIVVVLTAIKELELGPYRSSETEQNVGNDL